MLMLCCMYWYLMADHFDRYTAHLYKEELQPVSSGRSETSFDHPEGRHKCWTLVLA